MFLTLILLLFVITIALLLRGRNRWGMFTACLGTVLFYGIGSGVVSQILLADIQADRFKATGAFKEKNAIIVLGSGTTKWPDGHLSSQSVSFPRICETARLYFQCKSQKKNCTIIASGGDPFRNGTSEAEVTKQELIQLGIPGSAILVEPESLNTYQNIQFTNEILKKENFGYVALVSSGLHTQRAALYFSNFNVTPDTFPADYLRARFSLIPSAFNFLYAELALHERIGIARFHFYNAMGWNKRG